MKSSRYIQVFSLVFSVMAIITAAINFVVDPYLVFGSPRINGLNATKVDINEYVRTSKAFEPLRLDYDTLLVGNSRIEMGLNPRHECFQAEMATVYNLGLPGAGLAQQLTYALNVIYQKPVKRVFLSLDYVDFLVAPGTPPSVPNDSPSYSSLKYRFDGSVNEDYRWDALATQFKALLSLNALSSSFQTIILQGPQRPNRDERGFNPAGDFARAVDAEGPAALFQQKRTSLESRFSRQLGLRYEDGTLSLDFDWLERFLNIAASHEIKVVALVNPFHEEFWEILRQKNLYAGHQDWLGHVTRLFESAPGQVELWDFSMDSRFIHEDVPPTGVKAGPLRWFWEPSHYTEELGDLMLETMLGSDCQELSVFGRQLL